MRVKLKGGWRKGSESLKPELVPSKGRSVFVSWKLATRTDIFRKDEEENWCTRYTYVIFVCYIKYILPEANRELWASNLFGLRKSCYLTLCDIPYKIVRDWGRMNTSQDKLLKKDMFYIYTSEKKLDRRGYGRNDFQSLSFICGSYICRREWFLV